jgi:hypothetical protein
MAQSTEEDVEEDVIDALEAAMTGLVQSAPDYSAAQIDRAALLALQLAVHAAANDRAELLALGCALERCLDLLITGAVDAGIALPALAMASSTARSSSTSAISAALYEVQTLLPVPGKDFPKPRGPDVPIANLLRNSVRLASPPSDSMASARWRNARAGWPLAATQQVERERQRLT